MNGYITGGRSTILKIMDDLRDRYKDVFAILKELIQNADDAGAESLALDLRDGLPGASHPLLSAPGLLICNDGRYSRDNENGIKSVSASSKASDLGSAGRFGLGLKAVHHLCDAFIVVALGHAEPYDALLLNPYVALDPVPEAAGRWDAFSRLDAQHLSDAVDRAAFPGRVLAFWLPLRRDGLRPAPKMGFTTRIFEDDASRAELMGELDRPAALAGMLAATRHLRRLDLRRDGVSVTSLRRSGAHMRLPAGGSHEGADGEWPIDGVITVARAGGSREARVSGLAVLSADQELKDIKASEGWPDTPDLDGSMVAEKAEPHGACVLVRGEAIAPDPSAPGLSIAEGTFLPLGSPAGPIGIPRLHLSLFLHGYYFVDPGRRGIVGLDDDAAGGDDTRKRWNRALRARVVMPLIPRVLLRATEGGVLASTDLGAVVRALLNSDWFERHGAAICGGGTLAEVWDGRALAWGCFAPAAKLRPLPARLLGEARRLAALLPELAAFARGRGLTVCAADDDGTPRALAGRAPAGRLPAWEPEELVALIGGVRADALRRPNGAKDFAALLDVAHVPRPPDREVGRALRAKLREALRSGEANRAEDDSMTAILRHVPRGAVVFLPKDAVNAEILAALAAVEVDALVVGETWGPISDGKPDSAKWPLTDEKVLGPLLQALEPLVVQDRALSRADQAARAAVEVVAASGKATSSLAGDARLRDIRLFPVAKRQGERQDGDREVLSIGQLSAAVKAGTLFLNAGSTTQNLRPLLAALPNLSLTIVDGNRSKLFEMALQGEAWNKDLGLPALVGFVNRAAGFSDDAGARGALLRRLGDVRAENEIRAARHLVAGHTEAGPHEAKLFSDVPAALKRLVESIMRSGRQQGASAFVADEKALGDAGPERRKLLRLIPMLGPHLEHLLQRWPADGTLEATPEEGEALLACGLLADDAFDDLLRALPIHAPEGGGRSVTGEGACRASARSVPPALDGLLKRVAPARDAAARTRQERLLPPHDAVAELRAAVRAPHDRVGLREVILDALAGVDPGALDAELFEELAGKTWLAVGGRAVAPRRVLSLPEAVGREARRVLGGAAERPILIPDLPLETREHPGFARLQTDVLPDSESSFATLARSLEPLSSVGLPIRWCETHRDDLVRTAKDGADLKLPAWDLAAALLALVDEAGEGHGAARCLAALATPSNVADVGAALNALADLGEKGGMTGEAARRLYHAAFCTGVPRLRSSDRRRLFAETRILTAEGTWRPGSAVASRGHGIRGACLLDRELAEALRSHSDADDVTAETPPSQRPDGRDRDDIDLDERSARGFRNLLEPYRNVIPDDLALTLLGLVGRFPAMRDVMDGWRRGASRDLDGHLAAIDSQIDGVLNGRTQGNQFTLRGEIDRLRILIDPVEDGEALVTALSGDTFRAPLDAGTALLVGDAQAERRQARMPDGRGVIEHRLQYRAIDPRGFPADEMVGRFRGLVRAIADDCLGLSVGNRREAVMALPGMSGALSQDVMQRTVDVLRRHLPTLLTQMKTRGHPTLRSLVEEHRRATEPSGPSDDAKQALTGREADRRLWASLLGSEEARRELLTCVREAVAKFEYDRSRIVFELFQNADDATRQMSWSEGPASFRVCDTADGFDVVHWGRRINDRGPDWDDGERQGYHHDLVAMLMLHVSDKAGGTETTGKYGIGFKSVHALSGDVRVASGHVAARIAGGMLPEGWSEGFADAARHDRDGYAATLIRVPFDEDKRDDGRRAVETFAEAAPYLPLFAKALRSVEIDGVGTFRREKDIPLRGLPHFRVVDVAGSQPFRALVIDLEDDFTLAIQLDAVGPSSFPEDRPCLWWTAPLDERLPSGWMLNGPFKIGANRMRLAEAEEHRKDRFRCLGEVFGCRLLSLLASMGAAWPELRSDLGLDPQAATPSHFLSRLWDLLRSDIYDPIASQLHRPGCGLHALAREAPVVPAGVDDSERIRACDVAGVFSGALEDKRICAIFAGWSNIADHLRRMVNRTTDQDLKQIGFSGVRSETAATLLERLLKNVRLRVTPEDAMRLSRLVDLLIVEGSPFRSEGDQVCRVAASATFRDRSGAWRTARGLVVPQHDDGGENLIAAFAPDEHVLSDGYGLDAVAFVLLARGEANCDSDGSPMLEWARNAATFGARVATLRYLITKSPWDSFASGFRSGPPNWAEPLDGLPRGPLTAGWTAESLDRLRAVLQDYRSRDAFLPRGAAVEPDIPVRDRSPPPVEILEAIWQWWDDNRADLTRHYEGAVYPAGFRPIDLTHLGNRIDLNDREGWFTLLALACFQGSGRTRDAQHRTFIESKARNWWAELAQVPPEQNPEVWIARLREWAEDDDLRYWEWRRRLIDLYRIARWLPEYARAVTLLPKAVMAAGPAAPTLRELLAPGASPIWREAGLEAASLFRTLGLGANWMVRELVRTGFWQGEEAVTMAPYGWASTGRVRSLMRRLHHDIGEKADMDLSRDICSFVSAHLPHRRADLQRDGDLPLQIIAREEHRSALDARFSDPPQAPHDAADGDEDEDALLGEPAE